MNKKLYLVMIASIIAIMLIYVGYSLHKVSMGNGIEYAIGDTGPAGGIIFYIDEADAHSWTYLEVAPQSTEWTSRVWGGFGTTVSGADGTSIGTGEQNTIDIVTQFGTSEPYEGKTDYAAKLCSDLVIRGYDDWYLPSKDELNAICYMGQHC